MAGRFADEELRCAQRDNQILVSIVEHIDNAIQDASSFHSFEELAASRVVRNSVAMEFIQIAEQARSISDEFVERHPDIAWSQIRGLRNRLVHEYDDIEWDIVFDTVRHDLPKFRDELNRLLVDVDADERTSWESIFDESKRLN